MASNNNITGVHISLIVFVMLTLILGVLTFMGFRDLSDTQKQLAEKNTELDIKTEQNGNYDDEVQALKALIGHNDENVGVAEPGPNTVMGKGQNDLKTYGVDGATQPTYQAALGDLRQRLDTTQQESNTNISNLNDEKTKHQAQLNDYASKLAEATKAQQGAEERRAQLESDLKEIIDQRNTELAERNTAHRNLQNEYQQSQETWDLQEKGLSRDIAQLNTANDRLRERINEIEKVDFEKEDGNIHWVDNKSGLVWINLGSDDHLPTRLTFSVYNRAHHGVGHGNEGIKGAIEITRILGPKLSQARIIQNDSFNPITLRDPIYTPMWSPGRIEAFAFAGMIDFDNDGQSDRALLRDLIKTSGAKITSEVDDQGNRLGSPIDVETKYLVVGKLPEPTIGDPATQEKNRKILEHFTTMQKEARIQGIRKINLSDFLSHIGYKPKRRFWAPGMQIPWKMRNGAHSTAVNETLGDRSSSGQVSGAYGAKQLKPKTSSGQTSKIFRGARGGN